MTVRSRLLSCLNELAGLPALWCSEPGQVRKEAATTIFRKCRGQGSPPFSRVLRSVFF